MPESYMEKALLKLAGQIVAYDEASLMDLWEKYAEEVRQFEPTRRWEESALVFGVIQAVRMKNQLFNYNLHASRQPGAGPAPGMDLMGLTAPGQGDAAAKPQQAPAKGGQRAGRAPHASGPRQGKHKAGKLLVLRPGGSGAKD